MPRKYKPISPLSPSNFPRPRLNFSDTVKVITPKTFDNTLLDLKSPMHGDENQAAHLNRKSPIQDLLEKTTGHDLHGTIMLHCEDYAKILSPASLLLWNKYFKDKIDGFNFKKEKYTSRDIVEYKKNISSYFEWLMMLTYSGNIEKVMTLRKDLDEVSSLAGIAATLSDFRLPKEVCKKDFKIYDVRDRFSLSLWNCLLNVMMQSNLLSYKAKVDCIEIVKTIFNDFLKDRSENESDFFLSKQEFDDLKVKVRTLPTSLAKAIRKFLKDECFRKNSGEVELILARIQGFGGKIIEAENLIKICNYLQDLNNYMGAPTNEDIINEFDRNSKVKPVEVEHDNEAFFKYH
ncbi:MAG TPA: hypothetical protein QF353_01790 [Gammaproteobacteria bacterium]|nr:hypothetical protein [Gammaproteobacteria bacterium]